MSLRNKILNFGKLYSVFIAVVGTILGLLLLAAGIDKLKNKYNNDQHNNAHQNDDHKNNGIILIVIGFLAIFGSWFMAWLSFHSDKYATRSGFNAFFNLFLRK